LHVIYFAKARNYFPHTMSSLLLKLALLVELLAARVSSSNLRATVGRKGDVLPDVGGVVAFHSSPEYAAGTMDHKTMYLADVSLAGQSFSLLVDTGSPMLVVPGDACDSPACTKHQRLKKGAGAAGSARRKVSVNYGCGQLEGTLLDGDVCMSALAEPLREASFLQLHSSSSEISSAAAEGSSCAHMSFLVADKESDDFAQKPFDGILGLGLEGPGERGHKLSILEQLVAEGRISNTNFALQLSNSGDSQLLLGDVDKNTLAEQYVLWVPLSAANDGFWQFSVSDFTLNGQEQNYGQFDVSVDSGTSLLAADAQTKDWLETKLQPRSCDTVNQLPKLGLRTQDGSTLTLLPSDFIDRVDGACTLAVMPGSNSINGQRIVLGDSFLRRYTTIFDRENSRLGFGVAANDDMAQELLPQMYPNVTGKHIAAVQRTQEMNNAFSAGSGGGLGDLGLDESTFDKMVSSEKVAASSETVVAVAHTDSHAAPMPALAGDEGHGGAIPASASPVEDYSSFLNLMQRQVGHTVLHARPRSIAMPLRRVS
jgi:cathepsin D